MSEGLAESFDMTKKGSPANLALEGVLGGAISYFVTQNAADDRQRRTNQLLVTLAAVAMKKPGIAAGAAAVMAVDYLRSNQGNMSEGHTKTQFFDPAMLSEPLVLDMEGNPVMMADGSPTDYALAAGGNVYPAYFPPTY